MPCGSGFEFHGVTYVNVISPTDRTRSLWYFIDRLLLVCYPMWCLSNMLVPSSHICLSAVHFFFFIKLYNFCSCVISYNVMLQSKQWIILIGFGDAFRSKRMDRHVDAFYSSWIRIRTKNNNEFWLSIDENAHITKLNKKKLKRKKKNRDKYVPRINNEKLFSQRYSFWMKRCRCSTIRSTNHKMLNEKVMTTNLKPCI